MLDAVSLRRSAGSTLFLQNLFHAEIPDWSNDPSDNILRSELKEIIDTAMKALPPKYRMIFTLRDIQGFNTEETAEILETSIPSVKTGLHRARHFLREKISSLYKEAKAA